MIYDWFRRFIIEVGYLCGFIYIPELDSAEYILPVADVDDDDQAEPIKRNRGRFTSAPKAIDAAEPYKPTSRGPVEPGEWEEVEYVPDGVNGGVVIHYRNGEKSTTTKTPPENVPEDPQAPPLLGGVGVKTPVIVDFQI